MLNLCGFVFFLNFNSRMSGPLRISWGSALGGHCHYETNRQSENNRKINMWTQALLDPSRQNCIVYKFPEDVRLLPSWVELCKTVKGVSTKVRQNFFQGPYDVYFACLVRKRFFLCHGSLGYNGATTFFPRGPYDMYVACLLRRRLLLCHSILAHAETLNDKNDILKIGGIFVQGCPLSQPWTKKKSHF